MSERWLLIRPLGGAGEAGSFLVGLFCHNWNLVYRPSVDTRSNCVVRSIQPRLCQLDGASNAVGSIATGPRGRVTRKREVNAGRLRKGSCIGYIVNDDPTRACHIDGGAADACVGWPRWRRERSKVCTAG